MSNLRTDTEYEIIKEGRQILLRYLGPARATRFWAAINKGAGSYLEIKKDVFNGETVDTLYQKIKRYQKGKEGSRKTTFNRKRPKAHGKQKVV